MSAEPAGEPAAAEPVRTSSAREPSAQAEPGRRIGELLDRARSGRSGVLVLSGEPGIGKTTTLRRAAADAAGMTVLSARGCAARARRCRRRLPAARARRRRAMARRRLR